MILLVVRALNLFFYVFVFIASVVFYILFTIHNKHYATKVCENNNAPLT